MSFSGFPHKAVILLYVSLCILFAVPVSGQELGTSITEDMALIQGGTFKRGCNRFGPQHGAPE